MGDLAGQVGRAIGDSLNGAVRAIREALEGALDSVGGAIGTSGGAILVGLILLGVLLWLVFRR